MRVVLLGPPASGKGTHGRLLASELGLEYLSTGALLRSNVEERSLLGRAAEPILARGGYLPDELMLPVIGAWLANQAENSGWVLDGFPRSLAQAEFLDLTLANNSSKLDVAISLEVPFKKLFERIRSRVECSECRWSGPKVQLSREGACPACGYSAAPRADDDELNFCNRHSEFCELTLPVIERYARQNKLISIHATAAKEKVFAELLERLSIS